MAIDPTHSLSQYGHRTWRVGDVGLDSSPKSIAQTPDGQIWVGTTDGLYRFDGKKFTRWTPAEGREALRDVANLFASRRGDLYLGSEAGLFRISNGRLFKYPKIMFEPGPFTEDKHGTVWLGKVGHHTNASAFCSIGSVSLQCHGTRDGIPCYSDFGIAVGNGPEVWAGGYAGVCNWRSDRPTRQYPVGDAKAPVTAIVTDPRRSLLAAVASGSANTGLWFLEGDRWKRFYTPGFDSRRLNIWKLVADRPGSLWIGTHGQGLYRVASDHSDHLDHLDGLSGDTVSDLIEDQEGSIWIVTPRGIDQLYDLPITRFTAREGLSGDAVTWLTSAPDGAILASDGETIDRISETGAVSVFDRTPGGDRGGTILADSAGGVWFGADAKLLLFGRDAPHRVVDEAGSSLRVAFDIAEDTAKNVWVAVQDWRTPPYGWLWRFNQGHRVQRILAPADTGHYSIYRIASDLSGGLWASVYGRGLYHVRRGAFERIESVAAEAGKPILQIAPVAPNEVWLATQTGAVWLKNGRTRVLDSASGLPCDTVYGVAPSGSGDLWLTTQCNLVKVPAAELGRWQRQPGYRVRVSALGPTSGYVGDETSRLVWSGDGRLWFAGGSDAYRVDPAHLPTNHVPPPVQVQGVEADQRSFAAADRVVLPKLTRNLEIDYAGLSYRQPDLLTFRYRLFGQDREWNNVGKRRSAFYNGLAPGTYRFQVTACNTDGACNTQGASVIFIIPPAWWQTWWFTVFWVFAAIALIAAAIRWRLNAYAERTRMRFDERLEERTRVARDLHDTLMQTVFASRLLAEGGRSIDTVLESRAAFSRLSEWLGYASDEGRAAVDSLRSTATDTEHLENTFQLAALEGRIGGRPVLEIDVVGEPRSLHPIVQDEIHRIGVEAIRNACAHADATNVQVLLYYTRSLTLRVRDDGRGIDEAVLRAGKAGHFGLVGMRERAEHIGAKLIITSTESGTEVTLVVPGHVAFATRPSYFGLFRRFWKRALRHIW